MTSVLERSPSCNSSIGSPPMSSPRLSVHRDRISPTREQSFSHVHDRLNGLDAQVLELRSTTLTKDEYVQRRNREDDYIRREFAAQRAVSDRIESNVIRIESNLFRVESNVDRIDRNVTVLRTDVDQLKSDMKESKLFMKESKLFMNEAKSYQTINRAFQHNTYAHRPQAQIKPVPVMNDATVELEWPRWFPRNVWQFWSLTQRSRVERLVELAEFYQLSGYQYWGLEHPSYTAFDSDSDDSVDDGRPRLTRAEAVRRYPDEALQALAPTLGLVLSEIRKEIEREMPRPRKRQQAEVASISSRSKTKPHKMPWPSKPGFPTLSEVIGGVDDPRKSTSSEKPATILGYDPPRYDGSSWRSLDRDEIATHMRDESKTYHRAVTEGRIHVEPPEPEIPTASPELRSNPPTASNRSRRGQGSATQASETKGRTAGPLDLDDPIPAPSVGSGVTTEPTSSVAAERLAAAQASQKKAPAAWAPTPGGPGLLLNEPSTPPAGQAEPLAATQVRSAVPTQPLSPVARRTEQSSESDASSSDGSSSRN